MAISVVLFVAYILSLFFALRTHRHLYAGSGHESETPADTGWRRPAMVLLAATAGVAWMSELLVGAVEEASHVLGFTEVFVGAIVVAIIGSAAEHSTAVMVAMKNKMDITVNIAVGSSLQIALFVAPPLVFVSNFIGPHPMDLLFTPFEVLAVLIAVWVVHMVAQDGGATGSRVRSCSPSTWSSASHSTFFPEPYSSRAPYFLPSADGGF